MTVIREIIPFLLPLVIAEFALLAYTLWHILHHAHYRRGSRVLWLIVAIVGMNFVGPVLYFLLGKGED